MSVLTSDRLDRWTRDTRLVALVPLAALAWAVFVSGADAPFWTAVLAAGLIGSAVATAAVVHSRSLPSLAQVIASAGAEAVVVPDSCGNTSGAGLCSRGERKP